LRWLPADVTDFANGASEWWEGEDNDAVDGTPHLAYLLANPAIIVDADVHGTLIDDRAYKGVPAYAELNDELTKHVARLKEMYKDRDPVHYSALSHGLER